MLLALLVPAAMLCGAAQAGPSAFCGKAGAQHWNGISEALVGHWAIRHHAGYARAGAMVIPFPADPEQEVLTIARFGEVDRDKVEAAARLVGVHDFILSLPQGYDSPVGRDGAMLSGGQRQRIALARALYDEPAFVVLDEPNSSLDENGDAALNAAIASLKQRGTTFVIITHRTSVLAIADHMLLLRDGNQQAFGPRDQVLAALNQAAQQAQGAAQPVARPALSPAA